MIDWLVDQLCLKLLGKTLLEKIYREDILINNYVLSIKNRKNIIISNYILTKASRKNITISKAILFQLFK